MYRYYYKGRTIYVENAKRIGVSFDYMKKLFGSSREDVMRQIDKNQRESF